jgi:hypothetical protein
MAFSYGYGSGLVYKNSFPFCGKFPTGVSISAELMFNFNRLWNNHSNFYTYATVLSDLTNLKIYKLKYFEFKPWRNNTGHVEQEN